MNPKVVIFDLDGTLAESKSAIKPEMAHILKKLLNKVKVAIISGGNWNQFQQQVINHLKLNNQQSANLHLFPTTGTSYYAFYNNDWQNIYADDFSQSESEKILNALNQVLDANKHLLPSQCWGERIENRGSQITFSAMGQDAPYQHKKDWDPSFQKRLSLIDQLIRIIPEFEIKAGGATSIDINNKNIDKSYGINKIQKFLDIPKDRMIFIGDALFPGGNDYPVMKTGVEIRATKNPSNTIKIIKEVMKLL